MPGPFDELEKEAESLERQSKEELNRKNFIAAISLIEEAREIYSKLGYTGKIGMIDKRISQLKNLVKFEKQDTLEKTKSEIELQKRVNTVLEEKERYYEKKLAEKQAVNPEIKKIIEKIQLLKEKADKEEKLGKYDRLIARYEYLLELYKSIPKEIVNFSKEIYEIETKIAKIRERL